MTVDENDQFKMDGKDELKWHEVKGEMDLWSEKQVNTVVKDRQEISHLPKGGNNITADITEAADESG